jgi:hypothetical protein
MRGIINRMMTTSIDIVHHVVVQRPEPVRVSAHSTKSYA